MNLIRVLIAAVTLCWAAACQVGPAPPDQPDPSPSGSGMTTQLDADVRLAIHGAEVAEAAQETQLVAAEAGAGDESGRSVMALGTFPSVTLEDGRRVAISLVIVGGRWKGPGEYVIQPPEGEPEAGRDDMVTVRIEAPEGAPEQTVTFDRLTEPCRAEIGGGGHSGSLECPGLQSASGAQVSVSFTWSGRPVPTARPTRTP